MADTDLGHGLHDECPEAKLTECEQLVFIGEAVFYLAWALSVAAGIHLLSLASVNYATVYHMLSIAAPTFMFTIGPMFILYVGAYAMATGDDVGTLYTQISAGVIYHVGVSLSYACMFVISLVVEQTMQ